LRHIIPSKKAKSAQGVMYKTHLQKVVAMSGSRYALWVLAVISFLESAILPIPVDPFALPIMLSNRRRLWQAAIIASLASVAGGCLGYFIGAYLAETFGAWVINSYGLESQFSTFKTDLNDKGVEMIAIAALSPLPYKLGAIAAGVVKFSFPAFFLTSLICRSLRFFAIAGAVYVLGPAFETAFKRHTGIFTITIIAVTAAGFAGLYFIS